MAERVTFLPIQEGEGDPSPESIRPIRPGLIIDGIGEIYGGYVDVEAGTVVETWTKIVADGVNIVANRGNYNSSVIQSYGGAIVYLQPLGEGGPSNALCDTLPLNKNIAPTIHTFAVGQMYAVFYIFPYSDYETTPSNKEIQDATNEWLKQHPTTFVYKRRGGTDVTHTLTPTQLNDALRQLGYKFPNTLETRRRIIQATPHAVTPQNNSLVTFNTDMKAPLKECKVHFSPVQEGEGDPSPDNVRPITGWDGITFHQSRLNLFDQDKLLGVTGWSKTSDYFGDAPIYSGTIQRLANGNFSDSFAYGIPVDFKYKENTAYRIEWWWKRHTPNTNNGMRAAFVYTDETSQTAGSQSNNTENFIRYYANSNASKTLKMIRLTYNSSTSIYLAGFSIYELDQHPLANEKALDSASSIDVSFGESAGSIYGGYVDLTTGELWKNFKQVVLDGTIKPYRGHSAYDGTTATNRLFYVHQMPYGSPAASSEDAAYCTTRVYKNKPTWATPNENVGMFTINSFNQLHVVFENDALGILEDESWQDRNTKITNYLIENPMTFVLPMRVPELVVTLSVNQLKSLRGTNNIWSNANGPIELSYWKH